MARESASWEPRPGNPCHDPDLALFTRIYPDLAGFLSDIKKGGFQLQPPRAGLSRDSRRPRENVVGVNLALALNELC